MGYERVEADAYMTPKWCVESLLSKWTPRSKYVWEPACGTGNISTILKEHNYYVISTDINQYGYGEYLQDFLNCDDKFCCIITNPPYTLIPEFIEKALRATENLKGQVAFLLRHEWDAPKSHRKWLGYPFAGKYILPKRPIWFPERELKASPRFPYAWYIWDWQYDEKPIIEFLD